jgi:NAD(P)-dependent dehydrogenase (short-subunit alcohol dehydrogenase family)
VSDSGDVGEARLSAYAAAKAGAAGCVRSIAKEAGRYGITCNAVSRSTLEPATAGEQLAASITSDHSRAQLPRSVIRRFALQKGLLF